MSEIIKVNTDRMGMDIERLDLLIKVFRKRLESMKAHADIIISILSEEERSKYIGPLREGIEILDETVNNYELMNQFEESARRKYDKCTDRVEAVIRGIKI